MGSQACGAAASISVTTSTITGRFASSLPGCKLIRCPQSRHATRGKGVKLMSPSGQESVVEEVDRVATAGLERHHSVVGIRRSILHRVHKHVTVACVPVFVV